MRRRVNRLMGGGRTVAWDNFSGADNTQLTMHPSTSGHVWRHEQSSGLLPVIASNRLNAPDGGNAIMFLVSKLRRRHGEVQADVIRTGAGQATNCFLFINLGHRPAALNPRRYMSMRYVLGSGANVWQTTVDNLTVAGSNITTVLTQDQVYRIRFVRRGPVYLMYQDGALLQRAEVVHPRVGLTFSGLQLQAPAGVVGYPLKLDNWMVVR